MRISAWIGGVALGALAAGGASAGTLNVTSGGIYSYNTVSVNNVAEYATALGLALNGSQAPDLWVFCVDLPHNINVNIGSQLSYNPPLVYQRGGVYTDSSGQYSGTGNPLSKKQSGEIGYLTSIGAGIAEQNFDKGGSGFTSTVQDQLSGIQGAIWEIEYPTATITDPGYGIGGYVAQAAASGWVGYTNGIYPVGANGQGFGTSQGFSTTVPEPSTWAMMVLGFAGLGFAGSRVVKTKAALV
jgi:hypothetical protein